MHTCLAEVQDRLSRQHKIVLATIIWCNGSTYRRPGARMVFDCSDNWSSGILSGGCFEADIKERAQHLSASTPSEIVHYDLRGDPYQQISSGLNLGCQGETAVFLQLIASPIDQTQLELLLGINQGKATLKVATIIRIAGTTDFNVGQKFVLGPSFLHHHQVPLEWEESLAIPSAASKVVDVQYRTANITWFCESLQPTPSILVCGAGTDARPVVQLAQLMNWRVLLADHRSGWIKPEIWPGVDKLIFARPGQLPSALGEDRPEWIVMMTHNFEIDLQLLEALLPHQPNYLGILGPRKRLEQLKQVLADTGKNFTEAVWDRVFCPVGIDLGGDDPASIALSIVSQIQSFMHHRTRQDHLHLKRGFIHPRANPEEPSFATAQAGLG